MSVGRFLQQGAAGNAGEAVYVDDVFSTYLYDGANGSTSNEAVTVSNGIDLYNEGGLIWFKRRDVSNGNALFDSQRDSFASYLRTEGTNTQSTLSGHVTANSNGNGFTLSSTGFGITNNTSPATYASWTFRKQPGFFDIVTWTGDDVQGRSISHNLGQVPGCIIVKITSGTSDNWVVYHRSTGAGKFLKLNATDAQLTSNAVFPTTPTDSVFYVGNDSAVNWSGGTYVAYLFAHDAQDFGTDSDESIIKCGSYTGNGNTTTGQDIDVGFEPQFIMVKGSSVTSDWSIYDSMRGFVTNGTASDDSRLMANRTNAEALFRYGHFTSNGFNVNGTSNVNNASGQTYIYIAIRRPHKPASEFAATDLFKTVVGTGNPAPNFISGFPVDMYFNRQPATTDNWDWSSRLTQGRLLQSNLASAETTNADFAFDYQNGVMFGGYSSTFQSWMFRRAPGFFDVVTYTGNGVNGRAIPHNLGVVPEMIIVKNRDTNENWPVYHSSNTSKYWFLNSTFAGGANNRWGTHTETDFLVGNHGDINGASANDYVAYLFATVPGISKVGSYSGTGSAVDVDCGFTSGARFVLIKRTDSAASWYLFDTARGIVAGNDPMLNLNSNSAEFTGADYIDPLSSGFTVGTGGGSELNANGGTYLFLAIA
jgi:hypothetical protein